MNDKMAETLGNNVLRAFNMMGLAENLLETLDVEPEGAFLALCPPHTMVGLHAAIYASHATELVNRMRDGQDTRLATVAEVMVALMEASLRAPLGQVGAALYERLFAKVFGNLPDNAAPVSEPWPGACDELMAESRRRFAVAERVTG